MGMFIYVYICLSSPIWRIWTSLGMFSFLASPKWRSLMANPTWPSLQAVSLPPEVRQDSTAFVFCQRKNQNQNLWKIFGKSLETRQWKRLHSKLWPTVTINKDPKRRCLVLWSWWSWGLKMPCLPHPGIFSHFERSTLAFWEAFLAWAKWTNWVCLKMRLKKKRPCPWALSRGNAAFWGHPHPQKGGSAPEDILQSPFCDAVSGCKTHMACAFLGGMAIAATLSSCLATRMWKIHLGCPGFWQLSQKKSFWHC